VIDTPVKTCVAAMMLLICAACDSAGARDSALRGDELAAQKRYTEAAAAYRIALSAAPEDGALRTKLGEAYAQSGDSVRASDLLPDVVAVQLSAASAMLAQSRFQDVSARMAGLLKKHPDNAEALVHQGNAAARLFSSTWALFKLADVIGNPDGFSSMRTELRPKVSSADDATAETSFRRAVALDSYAEAHLALASFLWAAGRPDEGEPSLRLFADQNPGHSAANHALGEYYLSVHRDEEAVRYLRNAAAASDESGRGARFDLVKYHLANHRDAEARRVLESMAGDDDAGEVSVPLASIDARAGKPADAVRRIDALLTRLPNKPSALLLKAQILLAMGNPDLRYARAAVAADPKSSDANALLAGALISAGDSEGALALYQEAARLNPDALPARLALARLLIDQGRGSEALIHAKDAVRLVPGDRDAGLTLVRALVLKDDYLAAEQALGPLLERFADDPVVAIQAGLVLTRRGNPAAARAAFLRALQHDARSADALAGLVALEVTTRPSPDTVARVEAALAARPRDAALLLVAAQLYAAANDTPRAEAALRQAYEIDGANVKVGQALADLLVSQKRMSDAVGVLRQVVQRQPRARDARISLAILLEDSGHVAEARPLYEQIVSDNAAASPTVSRRLAALYFSEPDRLAQAFDLAMAAKRALPDDPAVNDVLGRAYTLKSLPDLALAPLKEAVRVAPDNALYRFHLGEAYQRAGNLAQARTEFAKALEIDPSFNGADKARQFTQRAR